MFTRGMNRREFVIGASMGVAGLALGGRALAQMRGGMGDGMGGGGSVLDPDPPIGAPFQEPVLAPNLAAPDDVVRAFGLVAERVPITFDGRVAQLLAYDGSFIAPTIRVVRSKLVRLDFMNLLPATGEKNILGHDRYVSNVHVHGWHVSPGNNMNGTPADNVHCVVGPGTGIVYEYDISRQRPGTLALYHPHIHGTVAEQVWGGMVGALDAELDPGLPADLAILQNVGPYRSFIAVVKDITIANGEPAAYAMLSDYMHGKEGDTVTVNAQVNPYLSVAPGEHVRLRFLNASTARFYRLAFLAPSGSTTTYYVIGTDGGLLGAPRATTEMLLSPGERLDALVKAPASGSCKVVSLPYARRGSMTSQQITLMTLVSDPKVPVVPAQKALPSSVDPNGPPPAAKGGAIDATFTLSMGQGKGYINGLTFVDMSRCAQRVSRVGTDEVWRIVNQSGMDHPWHQHVNDAQLLSYTGGDAAFRRYADLLVATGGWKDTLIVPKWGSITFRIRVADYCGMSMFHCHILEHEDIGMMGVWHIEGSDMGCMEHACSAPMPM